MMLIPVVKTRSGFSFMCLGKLLGDPLESISQGQIWLLVEANRHQMFITKTFLSSPRSILPLKSKKH